jgi:uncharacterized protein
MKCDSMSSFQEFIKKIQGDSYFGRLGKTFETKNNKYFYDTGTGKIAQISDAVYAVLKCLLENNGDLLGLDISDSDLLVASNEIVEAYENEHILSAPEVKTLEGYSLGELAKSLDKELSSLTLEVTQKCNFRCKYCIYNTAVGSYRDFGIKDMPLETAIKAIDFLHDHSSDKQDEVFLGFYGGEPLMNFPLIERCVNYANSIFKDKKIRFSMTTNASLITDAVAEFIFNNRIQITISLDGPKDVHNENRVYVNGKGTFDDAINGVQRLLTVYKKHSVRPNLTFNAVTTGPDYYRKFDKMQKFFKNTEWLPDDIPITCSLADSGPEENEYYFPQGTEEKRRTDMITIPTDNWTSQQGKDSIHANLFTSDIVEKGLLRIQRRVLLSKPTEKYGMHGCCVPGGRKLFIDVDGNLFPCERVGYKVPMLGNVVNGFNIPKIKKYYIDDYIDNTVGICKNCWAIRLCALCYSNSMNEQGFDVKYRNSLCTSERNNIMSHLIRYHQIYEHDPQELNLLNDIQVS